MKGNDKVIEQLQSLLNGELGARDQYFAHSRKYRDWGLNKLYERINTRWKRKPNMPRC